MDIAGQEVPIHMRTDANNLVTTAATTRLPEQRETIHMAQMLRKESCSGFIEDLAHVRTEFCLSDVLTKGTVKPEALVQAVETGVLPSVDVRPPFRESLQHKAYTAGNSHVGEVSRDSWIERGNLLVRIHRVPRVHLFVPTRLPQHILSVYPNRSTTAHMVDGRVLQQVDAWKRQGSRLECKWVGTTAFTIQSRSQGQREEASAFCRCSDASGMCCFMCHWLSSGPP